MGPELITKRGPRNSIDPPDAEKNAVMSATMAGKCPTFASEVMTRGKYNLCSQPPGKSIYRLAHMCSPTPSKYGPHFYNDWSKNREYAYEAKHYKADVLAVLHYP